MNVRDVCLSVSPCRVVPVASVPVCETVAVQLGLERPDSDGACWGLVKRFVRSLNGRRVVGQWIPTNRSWTSRAQGFRAIALNHRRLVLDLARVN